MSGGLARIQERWRILPLWRRAALAGLLILLVVFGPYLFSRVASPWRRLKVVGPSGPVSEASAASPALDRSAPLRLVAYNIAHGRGLATSNWDGGDKVERLARLDAIAALLSEVDADIVVLNEVDFDSSWSHSVNQAAYLAEKAGYPYRVEERNLDFRMLGWTWRFGNAVLSRHPIVDAAVVDLPGFSTWETAAAGKKRAVQADVALGGLTVRVVGAHLSHRDEELRVRSAQQLTDLAQASSHSLIVAGDLNSTPPGFPQSVSDPSGANAVAVLDAGRAFLRHPLSTPDPAAMTFHSDRPRSVIDWILIPSHWHFAAYRSIDTKLSDHRPVVASIEIRPTAVP